MGNKLVSIVIPTLNEEGNIKNLIRKINEILKNTKYEIIIVDGIFLNAKNVNREDKEIKIISVGSLIEKKGFKILINAIAKLDQRFSLTIVG
ncbi:MAG: hypothetical protein QXD23_03820, partial [Candidatus Micrarchaeaceae archaeon]